MKSSKALLTPSTLKEIHRVDRQSSARRKIKMELTFSFLISFSVFPLSAEIRNATKKTNGGGEFYPFFFGFCSACVSCTRVESIWCVIHGE